MVVSFTGHRPEKIAGWSGDPVGVERAIRKEVSKHIRALALEGAEEFVSGMAPGFDLWAADELLRLRDEGVVGEGVRLVAAVPYPQFSASFDESQRVLYEKVVARAEEVVYVAPQYVRGCYQRRNDLLVERADVVLAYYEGTEGGTRYTFERGAKMGRRVVNIHQAQLF